MQLQRIVTLANRKVRLRLLAMERSLRAVGCDLPLYVIPYDDERFDLPTNAGWWCVPELISWLQSWKAHPTMRKYQCLTIDNFQFVDADVVFLRNPVDVLRDASEFVTSCGHWHNPNETVTDESKQYLRERSTTWQKQIFNTGQFACDQALFTFEELKERAEQPRFQPTCITFKYHEQPGINMLVNSTEVQVNNLTLPPVRMQSTWAGDYPAEFQQYWSTEEMTPYIIHWAGTPMHLKRPIDELYHQYLSEEERSQWDKQVSDDLQSRERRTRSLRARLGRVRRGLRAFGREL